MSYLIRFLSGLLHAAPPLRRLLPLAALDVGILLLAYSSVYSLRMVSVQDVVHDHRAFMAAVLGVSLGSLYACGAYHRLWARTSGHDVAVLVRAVALSTAILLLVTLALPARPIPLSVILVGNALALTGFVAVRYRSRVYSGLSWRWKAVWRQEFPGEETRVLIVGAGEAGQTTALRLKHHFQRGATRYRVVGFVDDDPATQRLYIEGCPVLGRRGDIPALAASLRVDLIVVAHHDISGPDLREILNLCEQTSARIKLIPNVEALLADRRGAPLLRDVAPEDLLGRSTLVWHEEVDRAPITAKTILVTGAAGSIGSELCRQLVSYGPRRLILLDHNESGLYDLVTELERVHPGQAFVAALADITDRAALATVFERERPEVVFHSAAYKHVPMLQTHPDQALRVNIGGTLNVAELARDFGAERFVLISTDKAVAPTSVMGASKRICELIVHELAHRAPVTTQFAAVRFGNVLGSRGSVVPLFARQIEAGGPVTVTGRDMTRFFMSIAEAVHLVIHAACMTSGDNLYMLQMGEDVRIVDLAERMIRLRGLRPYVDIPIEFVGPRPGEKLHEALHTEDEWELPTVHPGIVQLQARRNGFPSAEFWASLHALLRDGLNPNRNPLEQLVEIIAAWECQHAYVAPVPALDDEHSASTSPTFLLSAGR